MTFAPIHRTGNSALKLTISTGIYHMIQRFEDYRNFHNTVGELRDLNDAQLADMGLHRSEIKRVAHDAVYGTKA
jgi:uncharacterized protein YjiS (DUF1127 family)